jgi:hypothetical protein
MERITISSQLRQKIRDPISSNKLGKMVQTCDPSYRGGRGK